MILHNFARVNILFKISYELEFRIHDILWRAKDEEIYNDLISQKKTQNQDQMIISKLLREYYIVWKSFHISIHDNMLSVLKKLLKAISRHGHFDWYLFA